MSKKVTNEIYRKVKALSEGGYSPKEAARDSGLSLTTVRYILRSKNFTDYLETLKEQYYRHISAQNTVKNKNEVRNSAQNTVTNKKEVLHTAQIQATHDLMEEIKEQGKYIKLLSDKLADTNDKFEKAITAIVTIARVVIKYTEIDTSAKGNEDKRDCS